MFLYHICVSDAYLKSKMTTEQKQDIPSPHDPMFITCILSCSDGDHFTIISSSQIEMV
jgi:hypothetical protein